MRETPQHRTIRSAEAVLAAGAVLAGLYFLRDILIPVVLAILLAFLLAPLVRGIQRCGLRRVPAVLVVIACTVAIMGCGAWLFTTQAVELGQQFSTYRHSVVSKARALRESVASALQPVSQTISDIHEEIAQPSSRPTEDLVAANPGGTAPTVVAVGPAEPVPLTTSAGDATSVSSRSAAPPGVLLQVARSLLPTVLHPFALLALTAVLALFFLIYREDLRDRIICVCGSSRIGLTTSMLTDAGGRFGSYFAGVVLVNAITGAAIAIGLLLLGVPNALLFGILTAILRFVPFLGPWISAVFPLAMALAVFDSWAIPILVVALFLVVEAGGANLIEPWVYGSRVGASSTAILVSMVFWAWIWGPIGLLLATPIAVCLVVVGKYVPQLQFLYVLLGNEPVLEPHARFYQRLLAMEPDGAVEVFRESAGSNPPLKAFSDVVIPAFGQLVAEAPQGEEGNPRQNAARQALDRLLEENSPCAEAGADVGKHGAGADGTHADQPFALAIVPVKGWYDELSAELLSRLIEWRRGRAVLPPSRLLISEVIDWLLHEQPSAVCLVTVDANSVRRLELLCKRIRDAGIDVPMLIAVWNPESDAHRLEQRFARFGRTQRCGTLIESLDELAGLQRRQPPAAVANRVSTGDGCDVLPRRWSAGSTAG